jgi:cytochrome c oxidase subunit 3/cytochrome o ubiquinol oxidase subunit 3
MSNASVKTAAAPADASPWAEPSFHAAKTGMACFLTSEAAFFSTLIVAYVMYLGRSSIGPTPHETLSLPLVILTSVCLLSSSFTIMLAHRGLSRGQLGRFYTRLGATILLALLFLTGTAWEWWRLIVHEGLRPGTNLFGTTFFTLVGFHGLHVMLGIVVMLIMATVVARGWVTAQNPLAVELTSWYWHLVDGVWVVIFVVVYVVGR